MKKIVLVSVLLFLIFGSLYSQTTTVSGKVTMVGNPPLEPIPVPGLVYAIESGPINYIITLNGYWQWGDGPLVIDTYTFEMEDPIIVEGIVSVKQDIWGEDYYEVEVISVVPVSINDELTTLSNISIYPNPTTGKIYLEEENTIKVYNLKGALLQETFGNQVDLSAYPQGVYLLQVNDGWVKVVKE
jgi:hypothetical protein